jgi:flagellar hook-associated protein 2
MVTSFDPASTAASLATAYTQAAQAQLTAQTQRAQATSTGLGKLQTALRAFETAIAALSAKKTMVQQTATFSNTAYGTATAGTTAQAGTYSLFVEQVASAHQVAFTDLPAVPVPVTGTLSISQGGVAAFDVDFSTADIDGNGTLSQAEMARAINAAADNNGRVTASVVTVGTSTQLVLSSASSGAASQITVDASSLSDASLRTAFGAGNTLVAAQDAIVWLGAQGSGVKMQQASNTFTAIQGVTMTFTQAMPVGAAPVNLTVAGDNAGTAANVRSFVDAFNALKTTLDSLTASGKPDSGVAAGTFASDASIRALRSRLNAMVRQDFGGHRLTDFGVSADRSGTLSLNTTKLDAKLAASPGALDTVFGSATGTAPSGLLGANDTYLDAWLNSVDGQITRRQTTVQSQQKAVTARQARLDTQYDNAYQRYLKQFTVLQSLQAQMAETGSMFDSMGAKA